DVVRGRRARVEPAIRHAGRRSTGTAFAAATQELDGRGDDLGRLALLAFLVFPVARLEPPLDVDAAALRQVLRSQLARPTPCDDAVPLGALLFVAVLGREALVGREREVRHRLAALRVAELGIAPEIADQDHLVDAGHALAPSVLGCSRDVLFAARTRQGDARGDLLERSLNPFDRIDVRSEPLRANARGQRLGRGP